jgi:hypothetical protein
VRPGDLTGHSCRPKQVQDNEGLAFARDGSKPEDGTDRVQYSILKQYSACGDVMVHNRPYVDTEFFIKNDSYNIVKFGTPYSEYFL